MKIKSQKDIEEIRRLYLEGLPLEQIGDRFGMTMQNVLHWVDRMGLPRRGRGGHWKIRKVPLPSPKYVKEGYTIGDAYVDELQQACDHHHFITRCSDCGKIVESDCRSREIKCQQKINS